MKSVIFCTCFISKGTLNNNERYIKWIKYYYERQNIFGADYLFLIYDGSEKIEFPFRHTLVDVDVDDLPNKLTPGIFIFRFNCHLGRGSLSNYPGWWRSFLFSVVLAKKYNFDKIIHIESDFFVLSERMSRYIRFLRTGWICMYSNYYDFPETGIQVICRNEFENVASLGEKAKAASYVFSKIAEDVLPFTDVIKKFNGDRLGETEVLEDYLLRQDGMARLDYIGQVPFNKNLESYFKIIDAVRGK